MKNEDVKIFLKDFMNQVSDLNIRVHNLERRLEEHIDPPRAVVPFKACQVYGCNKSAPQDRDYCAPCRRNRRKKWESKKALSLYE